MQRNSQSHTVSIRSRCDQFKKDIRRQQIQDFFTLKRQQLTFNNQKEQFYSIYHQLMIEVDNLNGDLEKAEDVKIKIINLLNQHPDESSNWILIGNFMITLPQKYNDFQRMIFKEVNTKNQDEIYIWCLGVYINIFVGRLKQVCSQQQIEYQKHYYQIDGFVSEVLETKIKNFTLTDIKLKQIQATFQYLALMMDGVLNKEIFPYRMIRVWFLRLFQFYQIISNQKRLYVRQFKLRITRILLEVIEQIYNKNLFVEVFFKTNQMNKDRKIDKLTIQRLLMCAGAIFSENIQDCSEYRTQCIQKIKILCSIFPIEASESLFNEKLIDELTYLMLNHKSEISEMILKSFFKIIPSMTNGKLEMLLQASFDINLAEFLYKFVNDSITKTVDEHLLFITLKNIELLFQKTVQIDYNIFKTILCRMQYKNFTLVMQKISLLRFNNIETKQLISNIEDNFLTQQYEFEDEENSMNYSNLSSSYDYNNHKNHNNSNKNYTNNKNYLQQQQQQYIQGHNEERQQYEI